MSSLPTQPYQVNDFSGGITENFIGGGPTRYMVADNLWVTVDKKLEERYGSVLLDLVNYQLPSGNSPVNALIAHDNQQYLLGIACPNVYVLNPNWQNLVGPTGNPPLAGGNYQNQIGSGEWSHHTVLTNDSLATKPVKIYRGLGYPIQMVSPTIQASPQIPPTAIGSFQAITAGLPPIAGQQNISNSILLLNSILLANDLKNNLIAHMQDFGAFFNTNLHQNQDTTDIATLTAAANASDLNSLLNLTAAIISAYSGHVADVINNFFTPAYHWMITGTLTPLNFQLSNTTAPTTLVAAAAILDDVKTKFLMHEVAPYTHDGLNNYTLLGKHLVTSAHIGTVTTGPVLTPNYSQTLALANNVKAVFNAHVGDATYHIISDTVSPITFPDAIDLDTLYIMIVYIRVQYQQHWQDSSLQHTIATCNITGTAITAGQIPAGGAVPQPNYTIWDSSYVVFTKAQQRVFVNPPTVGGNWTTGTGTATASATATTNETTYPLDFTPALYHITENVNTSNESLAASNFGSFATYSPTVQNLTSWLSLLTQVSTAFMAHDNNNAVHLAASAHQPTATTPMISQYAYAMHWFYQYIRYDGVIFNVVSAPIFLGPVQTESISPAYQSVNPTGGAPLDVAAVTLTVSNIPTLVNGGQDNYDTSNVQLKIFRTINAGSTYYLDGIISNGTTSFVDTLPDVFNPLLPTLVPLQQQTVIYTSGGVVNFDPAPICKYITIMQNTAYYAAIIDTGQTFLNRIRQSIQNNVDSSPGSFFLDLPDVITGISNTRNNVVAFCANSTYLIQGAFTQTGQGQMTYQSISDAIGCVSSESIVRTDVGIFFAGTDGFYYTDGFQLIKLSSELNLTYAALTSNSKQQLAIYGCYDRYNRRVWWTTQPNASDWSSTQQYIFHVNFGVNATGVFTTASNSENYRPSSMIFWQGKQIRGDARGYLFLHTPLSKTDPQVNLSTTATTWNTSHIPYNYSSCAFDFGTTFNRKWLTRLAIQGKNVGNVAMNVQSMSDNGRVPPLNLAPIWFHPNIQWGQPNLIWGAPNSLQPIVWGNTSQLDMWRRFPATQLRADYKQLKITPAFIGVYRYQDWPIGSAAVITPSGTGTASILLETPPGYTAFVWPSDVVGYVFASQLDGYVAQYKITALTTTTNTNDTIIVTDPNNSLISSSVAWIIRGIMKQQRISLTGYNVHFTLLGKMQQAYHGPQDAGENAPGTIFAGGSAEDLTDDSGNPLTDDSGNPLTS
jgi:hypothetical protein